MRHALVSLIGALALSACGLNATPPPSAEPATAPEAAAAPAPVSVAQATGGACRVLTTLAAETTLQSQGSLGGYQVSATAGKAACSEPALGAVECAVTGPAEVHVSAQDTIGWALDAGQTGTLNVGPNGATCLLGVTP